jgi:hypothetical protein
MSMVLASARDSSEKARASRVLQRIAQPAASAGAAQKNILLLTEFQRSRINTIS